MAGVAVSVVIAIIAIIAPIAAAAIAAIAATAAIIAPIAIIAAIATIAIVATAATIAAAVVGSQDTLDLRSGHRRTLVDLRRRENVSPVQRHAAKLIVSVRQRVALLSREYGPLDLLDSCWNGRRHSKKGG
ncbi:hypothetical protein BQ8482_111752 [Mesorhizobium delmotii]|uniref:Uncharacterized protein n=1 Tax=Mesorhizobium delmotii TaxID=1631247 RepID=A0A2P9AFB3_9HYPH|nr:hypothetical protein BQ8482_111752 [Mesorhizobium delmotii]